MEPTVKALPGLMNDTDIALKRADTLLAEHQRPRLIRSSVQPKARSNSASAAATLSDAMLTESVPRLNVLLEDVQRSSRGLERLLNEINEQPASLIFGRSPNPPGPGEPGFNAPRGSR